MLKYFLFFFGTLSIYAQKEYCFQYDSAGNQRRALLCLNATDEATDEEIFDELPDNLKSLNSDNSKVQLYGVPNPATDQIGVYWQHSERTLPYQYLHLVSRLLLYGGYILGW